MHPISHLHQQPIQRSRKLQLLTDAQVLDKPPEYWINPQQLLLIKWQQHVHWCHMHNG